MFTAGTKAGIFEQAIIVTASSNGQTIASTFSVSVSHGPLDQVEIEPNSVTMEFGEKQQFVATPIDSYGNPISEARLSWEIESEAGSITSDGLFTAGRNASKGITVIALLDSKFVHNSASVTLIHGPLHHIKINQSFAKF